MDANKLNKLQQLLEIVQIEDLNEIEDDREKILLEAGGLLHSLFLYQHPSDENYRAWEIFMGVCESSIKLFEKIIETTAKRKGRIEFDRTMAVSLDNTKSIFDQQPLTMHDPHVEFRTISFFWHREESLTFATGYDSLDFYGNYEAIFDLLEGLPLSRLKKCLDCEIIFVQKTAREKKYCSDLCKNRHNLKLKDEKAEIQTTLFEE